MPGPCLHAAGVPNIDNLSWKQIPCIAPIGAPIVIDFSYGSRAKRLAVVSVPLIPPIRIILHPIGRVGDHKVRIDAAEHALDVSRDRALAAEETVPALELVPAMLTGARDRHRLIARSIGVVL
jgi:hypothetical protein